jgi:D-proline reductase (dithiol) PrdB
VQRAIESKGIPTVSVTVARDITERAKPPRAVFLPFMMGHHFGVPFHKGLQRRIILEALDRLERAERSGDIHDAAITWAQARREGIEIERAMGLRH